MEFVHHEDVSFIMENKGNLSEGIFVNREFSPEIEQKRHTMLPILRAARHIDYYKKQIRLEKDKIVIKGKNYDMSNIHDLPEDLNAFKVTSKEDEHVAGYFGELNPLSNFFPANFTLDGQVNSISRPPKQSTLVILMYTTRLWDVNTLLIVKTSQGR